MWGRCSARRQKSAGAKASEGFCKNPSSVPFVRGASLPMEPGLRHHAPLVGGPIKMRVVISNWRAFALAVLSVVIVGFAACTVIQPPPDFSNPPSASDRTFEEIAQRYL